MRSSDGMIPSFVAVNVDESRTQSGVSGVKAGVSEERFAHRLMQAQRRQSV
jgi:hypothetical protein